MSWRKHTFTLTTCGLAGLLLTGTPASAALRRPPDFFTWPAAKSNAPPAEAQDVARMVQSAGLGVPRVTLIQRFVSGQASYRAVTPGGDYFIKLPRGGARQAADATFSQEQAWARWAAEHNLSPNIVELGPHTGALATQFIAAAQVRPESARSAPLRGRILRALKTLHEQDPATAPPGREGRELLAARTLLHAAKPDLPVEALKQLVADLEREMVSTTRMTVCHRDFHHHNVLVQGEKVYIIDWATAGLGEPMADLARFLCNLDLPVQDAATYLMEYQGSASDEQVRALQLMMTLLDAEQYMWCSGQDNRRADALYFRQRLSRDIAFLGKKGIKLTALP